MDPTSDVGAKDVLESCAKFIQNFQSYEEQVQKKVRYWEQQSAIAEKQNKELSAEYDKLKADVEAATDKVAEQTRAYKATEDERLELLEEAKEAEELRDQARADLIAHIKERDNTQEEVAESEERLEEVREELEQAQEEIKALKTAEAGLKSEMMHVTVTRDQRWAEINELRAAREEVAQLKREAVAMKQELGGLRRRDEELALENISLKTHQGGIKPAAASQGAGAMLNPSEMEMLAAPLVPVTDLSFGHTSQFTLATSGRYGNIGPFSGSRSTNKLAERNVQSLEWFEQIEKLMEQPPTYDGPPKPKPRSLPPQRPGCWTVVRVYICSTIDDTQAERELLVKTVFPEINKQLVSRWVRLQPVDLRWGAYDAPEKMLQSCINEIDSCACSVSINSDSQIDAMPWFICLRGERIGYLQPAYPLVSDLMKPERGRWLSKLTELGVKLSLTSLEVLHAFLATPTSLSPSNPHAFAYFRDPTFKSELHEDHRWIFDTDYAPPGSNLKHLEHYTVTDTEEEYDTIVGDLHVVDDAIRSATHVVKCSDYRCTVDDEARVGRVKGLRDFELIVANDLVQAICAEYNELPVVDENVIERVEHLTAAEYHSADFQGRTDLMAVLQEFCLSRGAPNVLAVWGDSGCGKSAAISQFICDHFSDEMCGKTGMEGSDVNVTCFHIVGANHGSTDLQAMLLRLCREINQKYDLGETIVEDKIAALVELFALLCRKAADNGKPVVIVIDGVNELGRKGGAHGMEWVPGPRFLTDNVRIILTMPELENGCLAALRYHLGKDALAEYKVPPVPLHQCKELVRAKLAKYNKSLNEDPSNELLGDQMSFLLTMEQAQSPLYLTVACEQLAAFSNQEVLTDYITRHLSGTVRSLFKQVLTDVERQIGEEIVEFILSAIALSRGGLLEFELMELEEKHQWTDGRKNEPKFSRIYSALKPYLMQTASGLLRFFHQQLHVEVCARYRLEEGGNKYCSLHLELSEYFLTVWRQQRMNNGRGATEGIHHLVFASRWPKVLDFMAEVADGLSQQALKAIVDSNVQPVSAAMVRAGVSDRLGSTIGDMAGFAEGLLHGLEERYGKNLVAAAFTVMLLGCDGLPEALVLDVLHDYKDEDPAITEQIVAKLWDCALSFLLTASGDKLLRFSNTTLRATVQELYGENVQRASMLQALIIKHLPDVEGDSLFEWRERESKYQKLIKQGLPAGLPPLALVKEIAELGDLERAVSDSGTSYLQAFSRQGHAPEFILGLQEVAVPFLRQLGSLGRGRVIRAVEELACRFNIQQLELLMTCTNTMVIGGDLMAQIHTLSLYDGGLLGILLERCPTTTIGPLPVMQIRQNMCDALNLVQAGLGACEVGLLAHYLAINKSIKSVDLSKNPLDQNMKAALGNALLANPFRPVEFMTTDDWSIEPDTVELDLTGQKLLPGDALLVAGVLKGNKKVKNLNLCSNLIGPSGAAKIVQSMKTNRTITSIDVSDNDLQKDGAVQFADLLTSTSVLLRLNLASNKLAAPSWNGFPSLSKSLEINKSLKVLDLSNNSLVFYHQGVWHFEGLIALADALKTNKSLKLLNVSNNLIGPEGASKLVDALKVNESVTSVDVSGNKLGQDGALHFANLLVVKWEKIEFSQLSKNQGIVSLNLANNFIGLQGENSIMALAAAVEVNKALKKINLENNRIKDETRSAIVRKFKERVHV